MNRFLAAISGLLLVVFGCTPTQEPAKKECHLEAFDLSACDRSGLSSVSSGGIWHVNVSLEGEETPGAMRQLAEESHLSYDVLRSWRSGRRRANPESARRLAAGLAARAEQLQAFARELRRVSERP